MENINDSISEVQGRLAKLSSLELSTGIYDQKFKELFEAIDSIDAYRIQINQRLLDIDKELNSFDLNSGTEQINLATLYADMVELVDTQVLGTCALRREGSSPFIRTKKRMRDYGI